MQLTVKGVGLTVTPSLRRHAEEKLKRPLEKLLGALGDSALLELECIHGTRHHKKGIVWRVQGNLTLPGTTLSTHADAEDIHAAIDELADILKRDIKKVKERSRSRLLRGARLAKQQTRFDRAARLSQKGRNRLEGI
jgi:ribosomal subunit interface protein